VVVSDRSDYAFGLRTESIVRKQKYTFGKVKLFNNKVQAAKA